MSESTEKCRILVVEDEAHLAAGLRLNFELEGYVADVAATARQAGGLLCKTTYDVIVLDVMLPDMDGFALCAKLRDAGDLTPVIMLTARTAAEDRAAGLDAGADDYLPKPFEVSELLARVRSVLRRRRWDRQRHDGPNNLVLRFGTAEVNFDTHEVTVAGVPAKLTQLELDLLRYFADNAGRVIGREELLENVWNLTNYPNTRTVDNFIVRLRKHFESDPAKPVMFVSVRGSGYKLVLPGPG